MERDRGFYKICFLLITVYLLCAGIMTGCSVTSSVDADEANGTEIGEIKTEFTTEEFLADYDKLWEILEEDYIYFPVLESRGIDPKALKETTRKQLEDRITDLDGFYYLLNSMFGKMQYFAHLSVVDSLSFEVYGKYYNAEDAEKNGWQSALQNSQTKGIYEYLKGMSEASDGAEESDGLEAPDMSEESDRSDAGESSFREVEAAYDAQRKAVTFGITTFHDAVLERDRNFISEYLSSLDDAEIEHIIFDISGNRGGNDRYWLENIVSPFGGSYEWTGWWYLRDTELTRNYFFSDFAPKPVGAVEDHILPEFVRELELTHFIKVRRQVSNDAVLEENAMGAKRWVIIDGRVYSAADSFSNFCKATGWATLVGQPTLGDGQGITPVLIALPETGLLVRFSGSAAETSDGTLNAACGTEPDIRINPSVESSREAINRLIEGRLPQG